MIVRERPSMAYELFGVAMDFVGACLVVGLLTGVIFLIFACGKHELAEARAITQALEDQQEDEDPRVGDPEDRDRDWLIADQDGVW